MTLHIFNPEHDIALASGLSNFTAPHAGRQLRHDLGFLPAVWAQEGDVVLVDDVEQAQRAWKKMSHRMATLLGAESLPGVNPEFTPTKLGVCSGQTPLVEPWGWNSALRAQLIRLGINELQLPNLQMLETIRNLSHRHTAATLLPRLRMEGTVGEMFECTTRDEVEELLTRYGQLVLKAPWSSSGRGLRFLSVGRTPFEQQAGWFRNVVEAQGCVMVEPHYNKVKDFGMEFEVDAEGHIRYLGLSLFHTANGAYEGNVLATESVKREMINRYIPVCLLDLIKKKIIGRLCLDGYVGPFGIDMMIVKDSQLSVGNSQLLLHPCVEINLRRTMGHVALSISPTDDDIRGVMRVIYDGNHYKFKINKLR